MTTGGIYMGWSPALLDASAGSPTKIRWTVIGVSRILLGSGYQDHKKKQCCIYLRVWKKMKIQSWEKRKLPELIIEQQINKNYIYIYIYIYIFEKRAIKTIYTSSNSTWVYTNFVLHRFELLLCTLYISYYSSRNETFNMANFLKL